MVSISQLLALGFSPPAVDRLTQSGLLRRLYRGVYAVGYTKLTPKGQWLAAVLACGPDAVISHQSAAALWGLRRTPGGDVDVTAPGPRRHAGIRGHICRDLRPEDRAVIDVIPVTSIFRTILDEASDLSPQRLRSRLEELDRRDLFDLRSFNALLARNPTRAGSKKLKTAIAALTDDPPWTNSRGERDLLEFVRAADLPEPSCNVHIAGELVDFVWHRQRLIVEVDHPYTHSSKRSFEDDRRRDTRLQLAGYRVVRITYERLYNDPAGVIADLRALLASPRRAY